MANHICSSQYVKQLEYNEDHSLWDIYTSSHLRQKGTIEDVFFFVISAVDQLCHTAPDFLSLQGPISFRELLLDDVNASEFSFRKIQDYADRKVAIIGSPRAAIVEQLIPKLQKSLQPGTFYISDIQAIHSGSFLR